MSGTRICHLCGTEVGQRDDCPTCVAAFPNRTPVARMTTDERVTEFNRWYGILEIPFGMMHERLEELVGRPIWTHELVHQEALAQEIESGQPADFSTVLDRLPKGKPTLIVEVPQ